MRRLVAFVAVLVAVAACEATQIELPAIGKAHQAAQDDAFALTIDSPRTTWAAGEPIQVAATLTYIGAAPAADVRGSGSGVVGFRIEQLDGPFDLGGAWTADCAQHQMTRGIATPVPFVKSGGWSGEDPMAAKFQAFFTDPELKLDPGTYTVSADLLAYIDDCVAGAEHKLTTSLTLTVTG